MSINNGVSFTAYLKDQFSTVFDKFSAKGEKATVKLNKNLATVATTGKTVARSIDDIDRRMDHLQKTRRISVDTSQIKKANREIKDLQRERDKISGDGGGGGLGMLGKNFLIGIGAGIGIGAIKELGDKAIETTAKYQKMEAVLTNTLGTKSAALQSMEMIQKLAAETPFQVDELTASYVKLVNQGFKPTRKELVSLGDLASSTGKGFDQLAEAILDAQTGQFERLKEFGIKGSKDKGGDGMSFMFKGVKTEVDGSAESIRRYILSLGEMKGVTGSMAAISKTTGGQMSNMSDNVDMLWKAVGERLTPTINSGIGVMNSWIGTIRGWIEVPIEEKINTEVVKIKILEAELTSANTSEERRKEILKELEQINPKITAGINAEAIEYSKLAGNIEAVTNALSKKITLSNIEKRYSSTIGDFAEAQTNIARAKSAIFQAIYATSPELAKRTDLTQGQKQVEAQRILRDKIAKGQVKERAIVSGGTGGAGVSITTDEQDRLNLLVNSIKTVNKSVGVLNKINPELSKMQDEQNTLNSEIGKVLGTDDKTKPTTGLTSLIKGGGKNKKTSLDKEGLSSISGGSQVKNVMINITNLVNGGVNISSSTLKEGSAKAKDIVVEALLTAVNDANLAN